jgi:hypothetical protein
MQVDFVEEAAKVFAPTLGYTPVVVFTAQDRLQLVLQWRYRPFGIAPSCDNVECRSADPGGYNIRVRQNGGRVTLDCRGCDRRSANFRQPDWVKTYGSVAVMKYPQPNVDFGWRDKLPAEDVVSGRKKVAGEQLRNAGAPRGQKRLRGENCD